MKSTFILLAIAMAALAKPMPQGVTSAIAPSASAPSGCSSNYPGSFEITIVNVTSSKKRDAEKRQAAGILTLKLSNGVLTDQAGRTGYIASNYQFQFDAPPQAGAIYTSGFSVCSNNSVALGSSAIFYQCYTGGFYNLYDRSWAPQCSPIYMVAMGGGASSIAATQKTDGQPGATSILPSVSEKSEGQPIVTQISDGQPQGPTGVPVTQLSDGQPQGPTGAPVSEKSEGQPIVTSAAAPITQISDGQPQGPTGAPVSEKSEGQPIVTSAAAPVSEKSEGQPIVTSAAAPVTQISDGQPQGPTGAPVSEKSEGQPIVTSAAAPVTQISDGQPQGPTGAPVTQITDGQPQAPVATVNATHPTTAAPSQFTGAASSPVYGIGVAAAGLMAFFVML
ncbi:hypothetical protein AOQ84DRAFT_227453 [Glonium stellatum]|uniref:Cell wall mannoprotein PIR1-like C-terminal domain-containing protein n=1 Tax=Glonium stellatum TaxID=574774 RepID=A0A8E2ERQ0_9PEZI|nr:hypothetical protein AOQ84DRAFT_227453 [Glonium stellatum]